eukprot:3777637-Prymnesium_polylepis.1
MSTSSTAKFAALAAATSPSSLYIVRRSLRGTDVLVHRQCARSSPVHSEVAFGGGKRHHRTPAGQ